ncbi:hypothetical protein DY000_02009302 [Brassica cretica]|uniref:Glucan endo-1,3-beta-D-glucosidase n=1 Tax=Brassica cretica TaxID=69181 RepID=A0ABQ7BVS9_BRACR|nr:hypothetical protein DY000_02009302 [Brassica cretica]
MGYENLFLIVAETRWPSSGIDCEVDETLLYSEMFLKGLLAHLRSSGGTKMVVVEERKKIGGGFEFSGNGGGGKGRRLVEVFGWVLGGGGDALSVGVNESVLNHVLKRSGTIYPFVILCPAGRSAKAYMFCGTGLVSHFEDRSPRGPDPP